MSRPSNDLPLLSFASAGELRAWLAQHHASSPGMWLRIFKPHAHVASVSFAEVLDEGLCFGWSESSRRAYDDVSYLQRFTPRKRVGTQSRRNRERVRVLRKEGRMTPAGLRVLGLEASDS